MILAILAHTPVWVFAVLALLIALGVRRLKVREVTTRQLLVLPIVMGLFSLFGLYQSFGPQPVAIATWLVVVAASLAVARSLPPQAGVQYSAASRRIRIPGSGWPLALMMTIFFLRYVAAVGLALHPALRAEPTFVVAIAAAYGLSSGCFAARALGTWRAAFGRRPNTTTTTSIA